MAPYSNRYHVRYSLSVPSVKANKAGVRDNGPRRGMVVNNNGSRVTKEDKSEVGYGPNKLCRPSIITL